MNTAHTKYKKNTHKNATKKKKSAKKNNKNEPHEGEKKGEAPVTKMKEAHANIPTKHNTVHTHTHIRRAEVSPPHTLCHNGCYVTPSIATHVVAKNTRKKAQKTTPNTPPQKK